MVIPRGNTFPQKENMEQSTDFQRHYSTVYISNFVSINFFLPLSYIDLTGCQPETGKGHR